MPVRQFALLVGLFCLCLAIVGLAWASGSELYLFTPSRFGLPHPPTHPAVVLVLVVLALPLVYWLRQGGVYFFILVTLGMLFGSIFGYRIFCWVPSLAQHFLVAIMIATSVYAWKQKYYFEE
jgi:hypothetical protein